VLSYRPVTRVLHIACYGWIPAERRVMEVAANPEFAFRLVRSLHRPGPIDAHLVRAPTRLEHVRLVRVWRAEDPHRRLYQTLTFSTFGSGRQVHFTAEYSVTIPHVSGVAAASRKPQRRSRSSITRGGTKLSTDAGR
jgi:hypothetical protein